MTNDKPFDPTSEKYVSLATYRKDGRVVKTPVWVAGANNTYYVFSEEKAGKVKRIRNNGRMSMAACDVRGKVLGDWLEGTARIVTDDAEIEDMYLLFDQKYRWQMRTLNFFARLSGRYHKRAIIALQVQAAD